MCFTSASGCSGDGFTSPAPDFRRVQSVLDFIEVDLRLALGCFSERDDADFVCILRLYNWDSNASGQAQRSEALLAVGETVISKRKRRALKNACCIYEVKAMGLDVRCTFRF